LVVRDVAQTAELYLLAPAKAGAPRRERERSGAEAEEHYPVLAFGRDVAQHPAEEVVLVEQSVETRDLVQHDEAHRKRLAALKELSSHFTASSTASSTPGYPRVSTFGSG
jgi:hypothetical protein